MSDTPDPDSAQTRAAPTPGGRVFISYASQDAGVATQLCAALESAGIACWIAPRDVQPGQPYAAAIVHALNDCRALVLLVSRHSVASPHVHREVERASSKKRTVYSVRLDAAELPAELEYFLSANQWLDTAGRSIESIVPALLATLRQPGEALAPRTRPPAARNLARKYGLAVALALMAIALIGLVADRMTHRQAQVAAPAPPEAPAAAGDAGDSGPPPHSVAVLPFENLSGGSDQDYFSDGLSEELLNSLSAIRDLRVAARTSSFSFKGSKAGTREIARQLNVGALLEGSVRRDRNHVRVAAQLVDASTGFQMWSSTYDREIKDVLSLQTEIATAVTKALQATLMADASTAIELGGTQNPAALDAYLRGRSISRQPFNRDNTLAAYKAYSEAIALDPDYAKAHVHASAAAVVMDNNFAYESEGEAWKHRAQDHAEKALSLAPALGPAHAAMAVVWERLHLDLPRARTEFDRALVLAPGDVDTLARSGWFLVNFGDEAEGLARLHKALELDQLNPAYYSRLAYALNSLRRFAESIEAARRYLQIVPGDTAAVDLIGYNQIAAGDAAGALASCSHPDRAWLGQLCRTMALDRLHRGAEADAEYKAMRDRLGNGASYQYAQIEAGRGHIAQALDWLEAAYKVLDPGLTTLRGDIFMDPLRKEPRFQAIYKALKFLD